MDDKGWIKLHRKILENPIVCKDADYFAVWMYLLLEATHKECQQLFGGKKIMLQPGQLVTGRKKISLKLSVSESKVFRILNAFKNEHQIEQQTSNKNSLITILNWKEYQGIEQQNEHLVNNNRTASEQQVNNDRTTTEHKQEYKECKNVKNERNNTEVSKDTSCSEPKKELAHEPTEPPVITLTLNDKTEYCIYQHDVDYYQELYPAVNVMQQFRAMKGWCDSNPTRRKTRNGIKRFINKWISNEQDKGYNWNALDNRKQVSRDGLHKKQDVEDVPINMWDD